MTAARSELSRGKPTPIPHLSMFLGTRGYYTMFLPPLLLTTPRDDSWGSPADPGPRNTVRGRRGGPTTSFLGRVRLRHARLGFASGRIGVR
ncbi:hypothetical protein VUR80DRAFT_1714 [Thermomyces stellatus]